MFTQGNVLWVYFRYDSTALISERSGVQLQKDNTQYLALVFFIKLNQGLIQGKSAADVSIIILMFEKKKLHLFQTKKKNT